jgi:glycosyltransferase involved in cell wall biosynthesis
MAFDTRFGPIVHVVQHLRPGGLEVMALELARMQARRHPTFIASLDGDKESTLAAWPRLRSQQEQLIFLGKNPGLDPMLPVRLYRLFRRLRPCGVHTHHIGPLLYAGPAARTAGVPRRIDTEHDVWHLQNAKRRRIAQFALLAASPTLIADAPHVADAVARTLGRPAPRVILNGIDTNRFTPGHQTDARRRFGLPRHGSIIGIAARLETVKGVDIAIAALRAVPDAILAIAGSGGQLENLRSLVESLEVNQQVRFLDHIDDTALFYQAIDVLCLPSRDEGLPLALLEAQACGRRVVASRVGGVPGGVDPDSGILVDPENPEALARALRKALCGDIGTNSSARSFVERTASLETMASAYSQLMLGTAPCTPR